MSDGKWPLTGVFFNELLFVRGTAWLAQDKMFGGLEHGIQDKPESQAGHMASRDL